jgi:hypothetical protein
MAEPIANDWKAIHDRMQQIKLEESAWPCGRCGGRGWMPNSVQQRPRRAASDLRHPSSGGGPDFFYNDLMQIKETRGARFPVLSQPEIGQVCQQRTKRPEKSSSLREAIR